MCEDVGFQCANRLQLQATTTLWLGNVDDFVPRKSLESVLASHEPKKQSENFLQCDGSEACFA